VIASDDQLDLAAERLGGVALLANDEFFAPKENLLKPHPAEWREGVYGDRGKWMDGWETRRRRTPGHDWCIVRLGLPGIVRGIVVDTTHFRGNYPESCAVEGCTVDGLPDPMALADAEGEWFPLVEPAALEGHAANRFSVDVPRRVTHVRLRIFPDGGVARLRVYGETIPNWPRSVREGGEIDLAALENGGWVVSCSDMFFGDRNNLILPGRSLHMGDGWETRRRRGPGHDWAVIRLAAPGTIHRVELDTDHFKGNAPDCCSLETLRLDGAEGDVLTNADAPWTPLLPETKVQPHARHRFEGELLAAGVATHVRLNVFPDGGVARLRLYGTLAPDGA
jgi:allantoicase